MRSPESEHITAGNHQCHDLLKQWALGENPDLLAAELGEVKHLLGSPAGCEAGGVNTVGEAAGRSGGGAMPRASFPVLSALSPTLQGVSLCFPFYQLIASNSTMEFSDMHIMTVLISNTYMILTVCQVLLQMLCMN